MPTPLEPVPQLQSSSLRGKCLALLQTLQNSDGGWGFHPNEASRVEPSCWAIAALFASQPSESKLSFHSEPARTATNFLRAAQLPDGSWPASSQMITGSWITSLACMVLRHDPQCADNVRAGLTWLCEDFPRDSSALQRFIQSLRPKPHFVSHNDSYRGWGW